MPIDGNAYLVSQGWSGKGTGLRHGAISKPIIANQKKTLSGIGKDRDEAFPFWDHVFNAAASKIKVKVDLSESGEDESDTSDAPDTRPHLHRTSTGIISHRRPATGTPALAGSGSTTPSSSNGAFTPRNVSLLTLAKQEAARRTLYSMFFRGPIMKSDDIFDVVDENTTAEVEVEVEETQVIVVPSADLKEEQSANGGRESEGEKSEKKRSKKDKNKHRASGSGCDDNAEGASSSKKRRRKDDNETTLERRKRKEEKRARKEEKRRLKAERKAPEPSAPDDEPQVAPQDVLADVQSPDHVSNPDEGGLREQKKRKKGSHPSDDSKPTKKRRKKEKGSS